MGHILSGLPVMRGNQELPIRLMADRCTLAPGKADVTPQMNRLLMSPDNRAMSVDTEWEPVEISCGWDTVMSSKRWSTMSNPFCHAEPTDVSPVRQKKDNVPILKRSNVMVNMTVLLNAIHWNTICMIVLVAKCQLSVCPHSCFKKIHTLMSCVNLLLCQPSKQNAANSHYTTVGVVHRSGGGVCRELWCNAESSVTNADHVLVENIQKIHFNMTLEKRKLNCTKSFITLVSGPRGSHGSKVWLLNFGSPVQYRVYSVRQGREMTKPYWIPKFYIDIYSAWPTIF